MGKHIDPDDVADVVERLIEQAGKAPHDATDWERGYHVGLHKAAHLVQEWWARLA